ncbi:hypothetical protein [Ruegeria marisrubri]|uniref:hypothetical protein n=1 Tax=Ruegeria marisrubri TaxID=1685379 RepID=UPI0012FD3A6B|nr:hypothetical protein [Ruegeria marisrubri]
MKKTKVLAHTESATGLAFDSKMLLSALDRERFEARSTSPSEDVQGCAAGLCQTFAGHAAETIRERFGIRQTAERLLAACTVSSGNPIPAPVPALHHVFRTGGGRV